LNDAAVSIEQPVSTSTPIVKINTADALDPVRMGCLKIDVRRVKTWHIPSSNSRLRRQSTLFLASCIECGASRSFTTAGGASFERSSLS
jgi:hypothetical protein